MEADQLLNTSNQISLANCKVVRTGKLDSPFNPIIIIRTQDDQLPPVIDRTTVIELEEGPFLNG